MKPTAVLPFFLQSFQTVTSLELEDKAIEDLGDDNYNKN